MDILSNGRFDLGVGKGYRTKEFTAFGFPREQRDARLEEDLAVLQGLWTNEAFSFEGNYYHLKKARLTLRPVQQPHPPIWIGARGKKAVERATSGLSFDGDGHGRGFPQTRALFFLPEG